MAGLKSLFLVQAAGILLLGLAGITGSLPAAAAGTIVLTPDEKERLAAHREIRLGIDPAWGPFEFFDKNNTYSGISSDIVRLANKRLGLNMAPVPGLTWSRVIEKAQAYELDVLPCLVKNRARTKYLNFTRPYLSAAVVIITRKEVPYIKGISSLTSEKIAVINSYFIQEALRKDYPDKNYFPVDTMAQALEAVSGGDAFAFIGNLPSIKHALKRLGIDNLVVSGQTRYRLDLSFGVRKDWPWLVPILDKFIAAVPDTEKEIIMDNWVNIRVEKQMDWRLFFMKSAGLLFLVATITAVVIARWNRLLKREIAQRKLARKKALQSQAQMQNILDSVFVGIYVKDLDFKYLLVNKFWEEKTGISRDEAIGKSGYEVLDKTAADRDFEYHGKVIETGQGVVTEERFDTPKGEYDFVVNYVPLFNVEGELYAVCGAATDITWRNLTQQELFERMKDLERFERLTIGREQRMIELKKEINRLLAEQGRDEKYKIVS